MGNIARPQNKQVEIDSDRKVCTICKKNRIIKNDYYLANTHPFYVNFDGRYPVCKSCIKEFIPEASNTSAVKNILRMLDLPYLHDVWENSLQEGERRGQDSFGLYIKNLNLNYKGYTWDNSTFVKGEDTTKQKMTPFIQNNLQTDTINSIDNQQINENLNKNQQDVINILGYDPFESENPADKPYLASRLVEFLDESTLEDSFKLPAVIEIVKSFNQIDKINNAISIITSDSKSISDNVGGIKSLIDAKEKMLKSVLALAKDNGISVNHNNNKSKGAGTLSGIIKQLQEKGIDSAEINIYNIETCEGMKQVADISNKSILEQLILNENDYTEMIKDQREMIQNYDRKLISLEEDNRLLKMKIKQYENVRE